MSTPMVGFTEVRFPPDAVSTLQPAQRGRFLHQMQVARLREHVSNELVEDNVV